MSRPSPIPALLALLTAIGLTGCGGKPTEALVVYCAHDATHAEPIFRAFTEQTGIAITPVFDTEATKSLGLVERIRAERAHPRASVFWNNELLGTLQLAEEGLLQPITNRHSLAAAPAFARDPEHRWLAFGARMRVWIVNTNLAPATVEAVAGLEKSEPAALCRAKPMFGTTLTHYCVLARELGLPALQAWHRETLASGVRQAGGNAQTKNTVALGQCKAGWTDTDDFIEARDAGSPVAMLPARDPRGRAILIPNTVAILRGGASPALAEQFAAYLVSEEVAVRLATAPARHIPLVQMDDTRLPAEVREWRKELANASPLIDLLPLRARVLAWLRSE